MKKLVLIGGGEIGKGQTSYETENIDKEISNTAINQWLFNSDTIDLVLNKLMD